MSWWTPGMTLEFVERVAIQSACKWYRGDKKIIASALGVSERTLYSKLEKYDADERDRQAAHQKLVDERNEQIARYRQSYNGSTSGVRVEPISQAGAEPKVPVSERKEVQEVLPRQAAKGRASRQTP